MKEKHPCSHTNVCAFRCLISRLNSESEVLESNYYKNFFFLENYVTSEGAFSQNDYTINLSPHY